MTIGKLNPEIGKWQFMARIEKNAIHQLGFHPWTTLWIVNLKSLPYKGEEIQKKHYDGIHWTIRLPIPYAFEQIRTTMAQVIGWDRKPLPRWIPEWVLMNKTGSPRPGLIKFLTTPFTIPTKIKF